MSWTRLHGTKTNALRFLCHPQSRRLPFKNIKTVCACVCVYLCDANVLVDILCQVDHISLLSHHHDEASQRLRIESIHRIFILLLLLLHLHLLRHLFRLFFQILICCRRKQQGYYYYQRPIRQDYLNPKSLRLNLFSTSHVFNCLKVSSWIFTKQTML